MQTLIYLKSSKKKVNMTTFSNGMKAFLTEHSNQRLYQRFGVKNISDIKNLKINCVLRISKSGRLYHINKLNAYFYWNRKSKKISTFLTEQMIKNDIKRGKINLTLAY